MTSLGFLRAILTLTAFLSSLQLVKAVFRPDIVVAKDGSGHYRTVQAALNSIPITSKGKLVYIKAGVYKEPVILQTFQTNVIIVGQPGRTKITFNRYSGQLDKNGDPYSTGGSGTFIALADNFTAINIIFENTAPRPAANSYTGQAVALRVSGSNSVISGCSIISYQDSLFANRGLQYYHNCYVFGSIDFVFGYAKAYFDNCTLEISSLGYGGFTAQFKTGAGEQSGFVFNGGRLIGKGQGWLGRAWGTYALTIFANMDMTNVVSPDGWNDFGIRSRQYTTFYAEYNNTGVGSDQEGRVPWARTMTPAQIKFYLTPKWISLSSWLKPFPSPLPK